MDPFLSPTPDPVAPPPQFSPDQLIGKYFLKQGPDGDMIRTKIVRKLEQDELVPKENIRFLVQSDTPNSKVEDIMEYHALCEMVEKHLKALDGDPEQELFTFQEILAHEGPLKPGDAKYKGARWNLLILWDLGDDPTWEPRTLIEKDDPTSVALYAKRNDLLSKAGWKKYKHICRRISKANRQLARIMKSKRKYKKEPCYNYGVRLPDKEKSFADLDKGEW